MLKLIRVALLAIMCLQLTASPVPNSPDSLYAPNNDNILGLSNQQFGQDTFLEKRALKKSSHKQAKVKPFVYHFKHAKPKPKAPDFVYVYGKTHSSKLNAGGKKVKTKTKKHTTKTGKKGAGAVTTTTSAVATTTETPLPPVKIVRPPSFNPNSVLSTSTKVTWYNGPVIGNIQV
ncbi:hypothetical protein HDU81_003479 [Chytriomyces hyalinus]|nr:hypothetical protein HDU81_003479 [Chytriomyces hyalinus]